jgi:hypothetical protein
MQKESLYVHIYIHTTVVHRCIHVYIYSRWSSYEHTKAPSTANACNSPAMLAQSQLMASSASTSPGVRLTKLLENFVHVVCSNGSYGKVENFVIEVEDIEVFQL